MHPYTGLPATAFWRTAVADQRPRTIAQLWKPKFEIKKTDRVATFGSCFAQHISRSLAGRDFNWLDGEHPEAEADAAESRNANYGVFSARTGNIYTAASLRQWIEWAVGAKAPPNEVWEKNSRWFDPFRPTIDPHGFSSAAEVARSRQVTLDALRRVIEDAHYFIFTLGLTEAWLHSDGYTYPMCPGTADVGEFDQTTHQFKNYDYSEVIADMSAAMASCRRVNNNIRFLLTVSPVPLTATAAEKHILVATTYSKSVLRAVAGHLSDSDPSVDYFPSYEIITGSPFRARFFESNMRSVSPEGVDFVMHHFFSALGYDVGTPGIKKRSDRPVDRPTTGRRKIADTQRRDDDLVCEDLMLEGFAPASTDVAQVIPDTDAKKICIIGNSHSTALRQALAQGLFADKKLDIAFWAFAGRSYDEIVFENDKFIHPNKQRALASSGGRFDAIDPKMFDGLVFVGAGFKPGNMLATFVDRSSAGLTLERLRRLVAKRHHLVLSGARGCSGPTFFVPSPLISETSGEQARIDIPEAEFERFQALITQAFAENGVTYLAQPRESIRENKWTKRDYTATNDFQHANARYGALILQEIRERLRKSSAIVSRLAGSFLLIVPTVEEIILDSPALVLLG